MSVFAGPEVVNNGLILHLDAANPKSYLGSGTTWTDLSGNGNNGTLTNGPTFSSSNSGSIVFDGVDESGEIVNSSTLNLANQISISSWIYFLGPPATNGNPSIIDKWDWPNNKRSYALGTEGGNIATYLSYDGTFSNRVVCFGSAPTLNVWTYLTMTYDNQTLRLYKDSIFITSTAYNQVRNIYQDQTTNVFLMRSRGTEGSIRLLNARVSLSTIYNRALTAAEIAQNFEAYRGRFNI